MSEEEVVKTVKDFYPRFKELVREMDSMVESSSSDDLDKMHVAYHLCHDLAGELLYITASILRDATKEFGGGSIDE